MRKLKLVELFGIGVVTILILANSYVPVPLAAENSELSVNKVSSLLSLHVKLKDSQSGDSMQGRLKLSGLDSSIAAETAPDSERVYLHFAQEPTAAQISDLNSMGVTVYSDSWIPPVNDFQSGFVLAEMPVDQLEALTAKDYIVSLDTAEQQLSLQNDQARTAMNVDPVWSGGDTGAGVTVAVIDSGLDTSNPDFPAPVAAIDYSNYPNKDSTVANTITGHGTHVTGSLLGRGVHSPTYKGVAPGASLVFIKVGNDNDGGITSDAMTYAIRDAVDIYHVKIINISIGIWSEYHDGTDQWCQAVDYATSQGTTVFAAAGNDATSGWHYSGTVAAGGTTADIPINISSSTSYLSTDLVWYDNLGTHNNLTMQYFDSGHNLLAPISGTQSESIKGTESNQFYFTSQQNAGMYFLQVHNNSSTSQFFHIYYMGGSTKVYFSNADPNYTINSPAEADSAIAVGAYVTRNNWNSYKGGNYHFIPQENFGSIASFSSRGPRVDTGAPAKPEIVAPGCAIISARDPLYALGNANYDPGIIDDDGVNLNGSGPANYIAMEGTSMASPMAAGIGALILSKNPTYTPTQIKQVLENTAVDKGTTGYDIIYGWGLVNAGAAVSFSFAPSVTTNFASAISSTGATLNGALSSKGTATSVIVSFEYGLTSGYGLVAAGVPPFLTSTGTFKAILTGLITGQTYHYRAKADGGTSGVSYGSDISFLAVNPYTVGKIAFICSPEGNDDIYIMNADGSNISQLTTNPYGDGNPVISPDGTKIAYVAALGVNDIEIFVMNADGSNKINITNLVSLNGFPAWSPDGNKIAFLSSRYGNDGIYVMNANGSNVTQLTNDPTYYYSQIVWSPEGTKIAFSALTNGSQMAIYTMNIDGSNVIKLTQNSTMEMNPAWSPDGSKIAFTAMENGNYSIAVMKYDGTNRTSLGIPGMFPVWSPDGTKIAFISQPQDIYVMNSDGSNPLKITNVSQNYHELSWGIGQVGNTNKLAFITNSQTITAGMASGMIILQNQDNSGTSVNVQGNLDINLTSTSAFGKFDTSASGSFDGSITQVNIPTGSNQVSFYYKDTRAGNPVITATSAGYADITQQKTVNAAAASQIRVETSADVNGTILSAKHVTAAHSITGYAISRDQYGNFVDNVFGTWSLANKTMSVVNSDLVPAVDGKSAVFTGHLIGACTIHVASGSLITVDSGIITAVAGDANGDGLINMGDVTRVERIILGLDTATPGGDANLDSLITMADVTMIERIILGLE